MYLRDGSAHLEKRCSQITRGYLLPRMGSGPLEIDGVGLFIYGLGEPVLIGKPIGIATQEIPHQLLALIGILSHGFSEDCIEFLFEFR